MRIALISTTAVAVPPRAYGGTELVIAELAKMLTRRGHEVTVYATGDSRPHAELRYRFAAPIWPPDPSAELRHAAFAWSDIQTRVDDRAFDVVHAHQAPALAFAGLQSVPTVLTVHHAREQPLLDYYLDFPDVAYVTVSRRQALTLPELDVRRVIHHGLDPADYAAGAGDGGYAAFLGRIAPEKGPQVAIDAARLAGVKLRLGGQAHSVCVDFFTNEIEPRLDAAGGAAELLGEVPHAPKVALLGGACATLFPVVFEEPFGLVMIESMLVGTPVIAFDRGSVAEVVDEGVTGFVVRDRAEMTDRLRQVKSIDRDACRRRAAERWGSMRMARDYEELFLELVEEREGARQRRGDATGLAPMHGSQKQPRGLAFDAADAMGAPQQVRSSGLFSHFWKMA